GEASNLALHHIAGPVRGNKIVPRVRFKLFHRQGHPPIFGIDPRDHSINLLPFFQNLTRMLDAARPGDVRNVNQAVNAFLDFNKGTKVGQVADASMNARADLITLSQSLPGILLDLLHSQADAPGFRVNAEHFNFDGITRVYQLAWMFDPL